MPEGIEVIEGAEAQRLAKEAALDEGIDNGAVDIMQFAKDNGAPDPEPPADPEPPSDPDPEPTADPEPPAEPSDPDPEPPSDPDPEPTADPEPPAEPSDLNDDPDLETGVASITSGLFLDEDDLRQFAEEVESDPFMKGLLNYWKQEKNVTPYLNALKENYDEMSDLDIVQKSFMSEYGDLGLSSEDLKSAFEKKVLSKYRLDDPEAYEELDVRIGQAELKKEANRLRNAFKAEQQKYAAPPQVRDEPQATPEQDARHQLQQEAKANALLNRTLQDGKFSFKAGENEYSVELNRKSMLSLLTSQEAVFQSALTDGKVDFRKLAALDNMDEFVAKIEADAYARAKGDFIDTELNGKKVPKETSPQSTPNPAANKLYPNWDLAGAQIVKK